MCSSVRTRSTQKKRGGEGPGNSCSISGCQCFWDTHKPANCKAARTGPGRKSHRGDQHLEIRSRAERRQVGGRDSQCRGDIPPLLATSAITHHRLESATQYVLRDSAV